MRTPRPILQTRRFSLLALVATLTLGFCGAANAAPVGFMADYRGIVEVLPGKTTNWAPAAIDGSISVGDAIRTNRAAFAKVLLVDDTLLEIGGDTEILIDRMVVGDLATQERSIIREFNGHVRAYVGDRFGGTTRLEIHTPTAIVGVKGSAMEIWVLDQGGRKTTVVSNVEGEVWVKSAGSPNSAAVPLAEGQSSIIPEGEQPSAASDGLPMGLTPLPSAPQSIVSNEVTDVILTGGGGVAAGGTGGGLGVGDLVTNTQSQMLLSQTLDSTNVVGKSIGAAEVFETPLATVLDEGGGDGGGGEPTPLIPVLNIGLQETPGATTNLGASGSNKAGSFSGPNLGN